MFFGEEVYGMMQIWTGMVVLAVCGGILLGQGDAVAAAAMEGAQQALELGFSMGGMLCLWSGVMEIMTRSGLALKIAKGMEPALKLIFRQAARDDETRESIAANVSANLLGLGNAATPLGLKAMERMAKASPGRVSDDMCTLVVCNAASLQLVPTTVAAVRYSAGCGKPFDILPAVWITSAVALCTGLGMCALLRRSGRE